MFPHSRQKPKNENGSPVITKRRIALMSGDEKYHRRNKIETVLSVLKRMIGDTLKVQKRRHQVKEINIKVIL